MPRAAIDILKLPPHGIYRDVPFDAYAAWPAINNSGLSKFLRSPAHYRASLGEDDETKAKQRGTICHAGVLEPSRFDAEYAIGPDVKLNTKIGKDAWEAFCAANPGKCHVRGADGAAMLGCRKSIWSHQRARQLLSDKGDCEFCAVWIDQVTGLPCKARIDKIAESFSFVVDLKTTRDARPDAFRRSILEYGYHRQAAFTLHGLAQLGISLEGFANIAIEPEPPYALAIYEIDQEAMEIGWIEIVASMQRFAECKAKNHWPGYPAEPMKIGLPAWAVDRTECSGVV